MTMELATSCNEEPTKKVVKNEAGYWNSFYGEKFSMAVPSQFCVLVATEAPKQRPFVEFGCGNGRDAKYMASQGFQVFAGDLSDKSIRTMQKDASTNATFQVCDVSNPNHVQSLVQEARANATEDENNSLTLYNRFFLHSLDEEQELEYLEALADATLPGDTLYMEFRCSLDAPLAKEHGKSHFRRYVETEKLVELVQSLGFKVKYQITGQGMAKFKAEDPFVSRVICERVQDTFVHRVACEYL